MYMWTYVHMHFQRYILNMGQALRGHALLAPPPWVLMGRALIGQSPVGPKHSFMSAGKDTQISVHATGHGAESINQCSGTEFVASVAQQHVTNVLILRMREPLLLAQVTFEPFMWDVLTPTSHR